MMNLEDNEEFMPLRDSVFHKLRREILLGELRPGERLMEIHLAERLGVSRTPIREAIRMLEQEGLVVMLPRRGAQVAKITEKSMNDVLEVRSALDILCAQLACERISREALVSLREACIHFEEVVASDDTRLIAQADVDFHDIIIRATGNERLLLLIENLSQLMYRYRYEYIKEAGGHENLVAEHRRILSAIEKGDKAEAASAAREHIENQKKAIISSIRKEKS